MKKTVIKRKPRKWSPPTEFSQPEIRFIEKVIKVSTTEPFVTHAEFRTKYRYYPFYPDVTFLHIPLLCEVDGIRWHKRTKRQMAKDDAKNACYIGEGKYTFRVTDKTLISYLSHVVDRFKWFMKIMKEEKYGNPRVYECEFDDTE